MVWSDSSLSELVVSLRRRGRDFSDVEVKRASGGVPHVSETLCALANMPGGGTILFGFDESAGFATVGVDDAARLEAAVADQARALTPPVMVGFTEATVEGAAVVVATVVGLPLRDRPCRYRGRAYLRQSDGDYVMSDQEVLQLAQQSVLAQGGRPRFDASPVDGASRRDLDPELVVEFIAAARKSSRRLSTEPDEAILRLCGVVCAADDRLTLAGLYALGRYPQQFLPSLSITAAVELGPETGARTRDLVHLDGPLPDLLEDAMDWVQRNTVTTIRYGEDGHARDAQEIPMAAVRELVANALVHRDLSPATFGKRVEIRLKGDTLVIGNPGGLWGISTQQLGTPRGKSAVNEYLYELCKLIQTPSRARVIEGEGGGIREVRAALRHANMAEPQFLDYGVAFTVLVPRASLIGPADMDWLRQHDPQGRLTDVQRQIVVSMRHGGRWTNSLVREEFAPTDSRVAATTLQELVDLGLSVPVGETRGRAYMIDPRYRAGDMSEAPPRVAIVRQDGEPDQDELPQEPQSDAPAPFTQPNASTQAIIDVITPGPLTLRQIMAATGLSDQAVRYRLDKLKAGGHVLVDGGWGVRGTTYQARARVLGPTG